MTRSDQVREWLQLSRARLLECREEINTLNVFPVPDGDTGSNLYLSFDALCAHVLSLPPNETWAQLRDAIVTGAMLGARGNSGVIMSQIISGLIKIWEDEDEADSLDLSSLARGFGAATRGAYAAVEEPREGTILTVMRAASDSVESRIALVEAGPLAVATMCDAAVVAASQALLRTPEQLPALAQAGVVDAGGRGLVVVLESLAQAVAGITRQFEVPESLRSPRLESCTTVDYDGPAYEVMYLLELEGVEPVAELRTELAALGDSLVVVGERRTWNVHVHVDAPEAALEVGRRFGRVVDERVTRLLPAEGSRRALVVVCHGDGTQSFFEDLGAVVVRPEPLVRPSAAEIVRAINATGSTEVVVLPSDGDTLGPARLAAEHVRAERSGTQVAVIPTKSIAQSLAAAAVADGGTDFDSDVRAMTDAAQSTRYGAVTTASRSTHTPGGTCRAGDAIGLINGEVVEVATTWGLVAARLAARLVAPDTEIVTAVTGEQADDSLLEELRQAVHERAPGAELEVVEGGQPLWPLIIGVA